MKSLTYTLPWPPSVNHYYAATALKPRTLLPKEGREFKQAAVGAVLQQRRGPSAPLSGRLAIAGRLPADRRAMIGTTWARLAVPDSRPGRQGVEDDRHVKIIHLEEGRIVRGGACCARIAPGAGL